jgi:hypothetical protein
MIDSLKNAAELSLTENSSRERDAQFTIDVDDEIWTCYTVNITNREVLCYCNEGTASFVIDTYGYKTTFELFDWEKAE